MSEDQAVALTSALAMIALVGGALIVRRPPVRQIGRLALLWLMIFGVAFLILRLFPAVTANFT